MRTKEKFRLLRFEHELKSSGYLQDPHRKHESLSKVDDKRQTLWNSCETSEHLQNHSCELTLNPCPTFPDAPVLKRPNWNNIPFETKKENETKHDCTISCFNPFFQSRKLLANPVSIPSSTMISKKEPLIWDSRNDRHRFPVCKIPSPSLIMRRFPSNFMTQNHDWERNDDLNKKNCEFVCRQNDNKNRKTTLTLNDNHEPKQSFSSAASTSFLSPSKSPTCNTYRRKQEFRTNSNTKAKSRIVNCKTDSNRIFQYKPKPRPKPKPTPKPKAKVNIVIPTNKRMRYAHLEPGQKLMPKEENGAPIVYRNHHWVYNSELGREKVPTSLSLNRMLALEANARND